MKIQEQGTFTISRRKRRANTVARVHHKGPGSTTTFPAHTARGVTCVTSPRLTVIARPTIVSYPVSFDSKVSSMSGRILPTVLDAMTA